MPRSYVVHSRRGDRDDAPRARALREQASLILRYARRVRGEDLERFATNLSTRTGRPISADELQVWEDGGAFPAWILVAALELANLPSNAKRVADLVRTARRWRPRRPPPPLAWVRWITIAPSRPVLVALAAALAIVLVTLFANRVAMLRDGGSSRDAPVAPPAFVLPGTLPPGVGLDSASLTDVTAPPGPSPALGPDRAALRQGPLTSPSAPPGGGCAVPAGSGSSRRPGPRSRPSPSTPACEAPGRYRPAHSPTPDRCAGEEHQTRDQG
jgi:hypothetical protein